MKRLHIHLAVDELPKSIQFYSTIFDAKPTIEHQDYAKWDLQDPAVNFAISMRGHTCGVNHLGIQVDSDAELKAIARRLDDARIESTPQESAACCYAQSNKHWALDPQGIAWESFHTLGSIPVFGEDTDTGPDEQAEACCIPLKQSSMNDTNQPTVTLRDSGSGSVE